MYRADREPYYRHLLTLYSKYIPNDEALKYPTNDYSNVINITYYQNKKEAIQGKYDFETGIVTLANGQAINWKH
jgi:hypothetical protein